MLMLMLIRLMQPKLYVETSDYFIAYLFLCYVITSEYVCLEQKKVQVVLDWPYPRTTTELQIFSGFSNYYKRLITNWCTVASPLGSPLIGAPHWLTLWPTAIKHVHHSQAKVHVSSYSKPARPVPCLYCWGGCVWGRTAGPFCSTGKESLQRCIALFSKKLFTANGNYDVGKRQLWYWPDVPWLYPWIIWTWNTLVECSMLQFPLFLPFCVGNKLIVMCLQT